MRVFNVNTKTKFLKHSTFSLNYLILQIDVVLIQHQRLCWPAKLLQIIVKQLIKCQNVTELEKIIHVCCYNNLGNTTINC